MPRRRFAREPSSIDPEGEFHAQPTANYPNTHAAFRGVVGDARRPVYALGTSGRSAGAAQLGRACPADQRAACRRPAAECASGASRRCSRAGRRHEQRRPRNRTHGRAERHPAAERRARFRRWTPRNGTSGRTGGNAAAKRQPGFERQQPLGERTPGRSGGYDFARHRSRESRWRSGDGTPARVGRDTRSQYWGWRGWGLA